MLLRCAVGACLAGLQEGATAWARPANRRPPVSSSSTRIACLSLLQQVFNGPTVATGAAESPAPAAAPLSAADGASAATPAPPPPPPFPVSANASQGVVSSPNAVVLNATDGAAAVAVPAGSPGRFSPRALYATFTRDWTGANA